MHASFSVSASETCHTHHMSASDPAARQRQQDARARASSDLDGDDIVERDVEGLHHQVARRDVEGDLSAAEAAGVAGRVLEVGQQQAAPDTLPALVASRAERVGGVVDEAVLAGIARPRVVSR
eukprot:459056-Rhodomonas_salina.1